MKIKTWIKYTEGFYPTSRSRKLRYKEQEDYIDIDLREVALSDVKKALKVRDVVYYLYNDILYTKASHRDVSAFDEIKNPLENLKHINEYCSLYFRFEDSDSREKMIAKANKEINKYLLIDGVLYKQEDEPIYAIYCFGCGNNHASTSLSITKRWIGEGNSGAIFNAFDREKAIEYTLGVAARRGDTNSFDRICNVPQIEVFIPSVITAITNTNN